ncbi:hypothetical protein [Spirosoma radiotolerans]|uniref:Calx-beta domain-containing protein n=1 Tax=Spirosoma radiotolerans TaxID=1379870 RepID=A0A0E3ZZM2_9BACT|nr:hypothetical protein [Spirosoma radiotolerans]AKD58288.1 hypothetical protein SD10_02655 [Spirosoma radiotolerans]
MRKHKLYGLIGMVMLLGMAIVACETSDVDRTFEGPYFVRFTDTTVTYKESYSKPIAIQVHNVGPILDQPITVNYVVSGTAREGKEYTIVGTKGTVVIPAKASSGNIMVQLINNANNILESSSLTFTLTGVQPSTLQVGFGKNSIVGKTLVLTIQDDCLLGGSYTGTQKYGAQTATVSNIAITSTDCKNYLLSNWNIGIPFFSFDAIKPTLTFIDNGDNSLTVPTQGNAELGSTDTIKGSGAWNPRDKKITLNLQFKIALSSTKDTTLNYVQTYTPQ